MNRHFKTFLLVLGASLLIGGSAIFAASCKYVKSLGKTREFDLTGQTIKNFEFDCDTSNIKFVATTDSTMKVVYQETDKIFHTEEVKENTLFIKQVDDIKWYERAFTFDWAPKKATIYLPAGHYENLKVDNDTGELEIPHDFSFDAVNIKLSTGDVSFNSDVTEEIKIETSTGDISLSDITTKSLSAKRSTGNLTMKNINVTEGIVLECNTGKTTVNSTKAQSLMIKASTGEVKLNDVKVVGELNIKTSTGDVEFDDIDFGSGRIETSTGDVEGTLSTPKYIDADTHTGKNKVDSDRTIAQELVVRSDTGDIVIKNK